MDRYRIHGLTVASDLALPDARPAFSGQEDVRVTCGVGGPCERDKIALVGDAQCARLFLPGIATFDFDQGRRIHIVPHVADGEALRTFLLGSAWAVLLHQRGILPLHGCALEWRGSAWLFVGESGAGKSTMAAALLRLGTRLVSDDVAAIDRRQGVGLWPGLRSMKLAPGAATAVSGSSLGPTHDGAKRRLVPDSLVSDERLPLAGIIELAAAPGGSAPRLNRVRGSAACTIAVRHTFRGIAAPMLGTAERHLAACAALAGAVPFFRLERPWDLDSIDATAGWLLNRDFAAGAGSLV